jgi:drug/metabolite transporter (DMT)-like permease
LSGSIQSHHLKGLLITAIGGLTLTWDIPLIRLSDGTPWSVLLARSGTTFAVSLSVWFIMRRFLRGAVPPLVPGRSGLVVAALYGIGSVSFVAAVFNTTTANLAFILAFNTMFAALLSWIFLRERPRPATFVAMTFMLFGIFLIVGEGISSGHIFGDAMALSSAFSLAAAITVSRASGKNMGFTSLVAVIIPFLIACWVVSRVGFHIGQPVWILIDGGIVTPLSFFCLALGPRFLSGPEVAMFYLLETVLAPVWVWIIFSETPSNQSLVGGTILVVALVAHSIWFMIKGRKPPADKVVEYPI